MQNIIGVDLGGTSIKTALVSSNGKIIKKCEIPTEAEKGTKTIREKKETSNSRNFYHYS